jgi:hypothetical protein
MCSPAVDTIDFFLVDTDAIVGDDEGEDEDGDEDGRSRYYPIFQSPIIDLHFP